MWIKIIILILCTIHLFNRHSFAIEFIDLPGFGDDLDKSIHSDRDDKTTDDGVYRPVPPSDDSGSEGNEQRIEENNGIKVRPNYRRHWLVQAPDPNIATAASIPDKDASLKSKINMLLQQTMHDTELKVQAIDKIKEKYRDKPSYRIGFVLSLIKKSRDVLNELFNVAVKHRDEWKALEQLKIFELIVHTNVDTTNLVRQLVEIHIMNLNSSASNKIARAGRFKLTSADDADDEEGTAKDDEAILLL